MGDEMSLKKTKWNKKIKRENDITSVVNALQEVRDNEYIKKFDLFEYDFQRIIDRLLDDSFRVAVVGEFSSGKSTFLNALLGKDLLKHGATETTATITEIHNENRKENETYLDVYYLNGKVESHISAERIMDYTATESTTHAVAQEIEKVVINRKIIDTDAKLCFVDTPGLNGIADNHREKTIEEIKNAHACIYLMQIRGLGQSDIDFLKYISKYQHNIMFVQNFIDDLKKLEGETPEQKIEQQKKIIDEKIIRENPEVRYEIVAVSSRKALISKSNDFDVYNGEKLTEELRDVLYEESRFDDVFAVINNLMDHNEKEKTQQKDAVAVAIKLLEQVKALVSFENEREIASWEESVDGRNSTIYRKHIELLNENKQYEIKKLQNYLESEVSEIRKDSKRELDNGRVEVEKSVKNIFEDIKVINEFDNYIKTNLSGFLYQRVTSLDENVAKHMNIKFENMVDNAVLRIKQYTGAANHVVIENFEAASMETNVKSFVNEEDEITKLQRELSEEKELGEKAKRDIKKGRAETSRIVSEIESNRRFMAQEDVNKRAEIRRLGAMPEKETKYLEKTYNEYRGGLGILDAFFGPKKRTESIPYSDDTNQQLWKKKKSDIETEYRKKEDQMNAQIRMLESKKRQCDDEIKHLEKIEAARKQGIRSTQSLLETKIDSLNKQREMAKQEYLREAKSSILDNIQVYLHETIYKSLYDNHQSVLEENSKRAKQVVMSLFEVSFEARIKLLNQKLEQIDRIRSYENTTDLLSVIEKCNQKLEEFLCI